VTSLVTVRLTGKLGVDDADGLLTDLTRETGLTWREVPFPSDTHLGGVSELLLDAVISGAVGKSGEVIAEATLDRVRKTVRRWRDKRLDPPDVDVRAEELSEADTAGQPGAVPAAGETEA
jgi:hypothetical protein